ncbi:MAG: SIS domain-containing protein [Candidatus Algichlamydia australiensis]|nr:SIS domain-containing protein [Chlamydiales bacterium]
MESAIRKSLDDATRAIEELKSSKSVAFIKDVSTALARCYDMGGKLIVAGNGGSLCDAAHFAEELTGFFRKKRRPLPAICLSEPGHITCVANDAGFQDVFVRGVEALGKRGDLFVALTTSGNSENLLKALTKAKEMGLVTVAFLGKGGGKMRGLADFELIIDGFTYSDRIQEAHMAAIHILIEMVESHLDVYREELVAT